MLGTDEEVLEAGNFRNRGVTEDQIQHGTLNLMAMEFVTMRDRDKDGLVSLEEYTPLRHEELWAPALNSWINMVFFHQMAWIGFFHLCDKSLLSKNQEESLFGSSIKKNPFLVLQYLALFLDWKCVILSGTVWYARVGNLSPSS